MTGEEFKTLREELKLSVEQAAAQLEVTPGTFALWQSGAKRIPDGVVKLFRILNGLEEVK